MSKNLYLSYHSNHPKHLLRALPYSQGIRIKRICSNESDGIVEITKMMDNFKQRGYPSKYLDVCMQRLLEKSRAELLKSNSDFLCLNFNSNNPKLIDKYICLNSSTQNCDSKFYMVIPFSNNVIDLKHLVSKSLCNDIETKCPDINLRQIFKSMKIEVVYCNNDKLDAMLK